MPERIMGMESQQSPVSESRRLRVVQAVCGTFHHFDLARELLSLGCLERIYSTFNRGRLRREKVPDEFVSVFPVLHPAIMLLGRYNVQLPRKLNWQLDLINKVAFDHWVAAHIPACDVFVGISSCGLQTGKTVQQRGGKYVCDRGSAHIRVQDRILREEFARWGNGDIACDSKMIEREEREYAQADAITVPSDFARRSFIDMGIATEKVYTIPYGVSLERFQPVASPPPESFEVLFAGGVTFQKGIPYLLEAFRRFRHPRKRLRIVGSVSAEIRPHLARYLPEGAEVIGAVPQIQLKEIMSTSHVLVMPSVQEGLALVQGQAMACGCVLISTTNTGGRDLFTHGVEGFEVPIRSPEAIAEKLELLAGSPELLERMRLAALARVQSLGGWRDYGRRYAALLQNLVESEG
jgi:alpha-maltose-1-phosphate synthase